MTGAGIPDDPRVQRQRVLATYLWCALAVSFALALTTAVAPRSWVETLGPTMVVVLVAAPVGRLLWLLVRWTRRGDRRFAAAILVLLGLMVLAMVLSR
jgi:hypothetical protein